MRRTTARALGFVACAALVGAEGVPDDVRSRLTSKLHAGRAGARRAVAEASDRLAAARRLAPTDPTRSLAIAGEVARRELPDDDAGRKIRAGALALLGELYARGPEASREKAIRYRAQARASLDPPLEDSLGGDSCDVAVSLGTIPPDAVEPGILAPGERFWRSFTLSSARQIVIETVGDPLQSDTNLTLYGGCEGGVPVMALAFSEDRSPTDFTSRIPFEGEQCLSAGTYYLDVESFADLGTPVGFDLRIDDQGACVLPGRDAYEPDDARTLARRIKFRRGHGPTNGVQHHSISPRNDLDFVRFQLPQPRVVRIRAGSSTNADTLLGVGSFDDGVVVAALNDEAPGVLGSKFEFCLPAGEWFAVVLSRFFIDEFAYDLAVDNLAPCEFESEPDDTIANAVPLRLRRGRARIHGAHAPIGGAPDADYYRFTVPIERDVVLETGGYDPVDVDTLIELYDAGGRLLASDDDGGQVFLSRIERVLAPGTYYTKVTISPFEGPDGDTWIYSLDVTLSDPPLVETEPNDACGEADPVTIGKRALASLEPAGDVDHYLVAVGPSSLGGVEVEIQTTTSASDPVLKLYDDPGTCAVEIGCDDDSAPGLDSLIACCLPADASYVVQVSEFGNNTVIPAYAIRFHAGGECVPTGPCPIAPAQFGCP